MALCLSPLFFPDRRERQHRQDTGRCPSPTREVTLTHLREGDGRKDHFSLSTRCVYFSVSCGFPFPNSLIQLLRLWIQR